MFVVKAGDPRPYIGSQGLVSDAVTVRYEVP